MKLTRREVIAAGAGASAGALLGFSPDRLHAEDDKKIITKKISSTGEALPVIGIGTNRWVAAGSQSEISALRETLRTFRNLGGQVIDTAPAYRSSEKALGQLISELGFTNAFFLATKVDREIKAEGIARMQNSLDKLGRSSIDLMQIHNLIGAEVQLENLLQWRATGRIRYLGVTTSRVSEHAEMVALMKSMPLDFIQVNYSLAQREAEDEVLPLARERNIAVLVNRPFAQGRLFKAVQEHAVPDWATEFDCRSWGQFFLKYVVSHPAVTCAIPGMTQQAHAQDNMQANFGRLPNAALRKRQAALIAAI